MEPKKTVKTLKDVEKLMKLMQENRIHQISIDGIELKVASFKQDNPTFTQKQPIDDDLMYYSS